VCCSFIIENTRSEGTELAVIIKIRIVSGASTGALSLIEY
jgi:hypothetical protein